ncbi:uncharacterized protein N7529_001831 [Penicillium soppii]|uniref:uncharacterized protein n=1 Tax=Penicillium soppii TaxID=69789 RepID=UPI0025493457|nr:uncharacterized protein N7529_001831 [Penicillium soppii]KAJ5876247.1 hypothetical protein N7529_001831 [Penicillium soppii]
MKLSSLSALCLTGLVTTASAQGRVWAKPCYSSDSCEQYEYVDGVLWEKGECVSFARGMASYAMWGFGGCQFFNEGSCAGRSKTDYAPNVWYNSDISWIWSFRCT